MHHERPLRSPPVTSRRLAGTLLAALAAALPAHAQVVGAPESETSQWGLGLGVAVIDRPYRDYDSETLALPILYFENRWFQVAGGALDFKINTSDTLSFRARLDYGLDGYDPDESPYLQGMEERDDSAWAGGAVVWDSPFAELSAEYLVDVLDNSEGSRARIQAERRFAMGRFGLTPRLGAEWVDDKYVAYYFGVRPDEVRSDRAAYEGDATVNVEAGVRLDYSPAPEHTFFVDVAATQLGDEIEESPLVEDARQGSIAAGYLFRF